MNDALLSPSTSALEPCPSSPFKEQVRREWDLVADDWGDERWWQIVERSSQGCNERLMELAGVAPGQLVLDVGTGIGEPAASAARRVGSRGWVLGIDLAPRMVAAGRRRLQRLGLSNVELRVGDAESLQVGPGSFDAVLSRWTLMLLEDLGGTLACLCRGLVPGGRLAAALWGSPQRVPMISAPFGAALQLLRLPPPPMEPGPFWCRGAGALEELMREAGFTEVRTQSLDLVFELPSVAVYVEFLQCMAGPIRMLVERQPPELLARLRGAFAEAIAPFTLPDGRVRLVNETLLVSGARPAG